MFACLYLLPRPQGAGASGKCAPDKGAAHVSGLLDVARLFSPRVDARSTHLVMLDVDGLTRLFGNDRAVGDRLRRAAADAGLGPVHVAIAATRTAAMLLAAARAGVTVVPPGEETAALSPLPLRTLEVCNGTDPAALPVLARWGIRTLGQLAALPAVELSERIGQTGLRWQCLARGEDPEPLVPTRDDEVFEAVVDLEWPIEGLEPLSFVLASLFDPLCQRLERRDRGAAVLHLDLRLVTKETHSRTLELPAPMRDPKVLRTLLLLDLESHPAPAGIDRVTIAIVPTPGRHVQESLLTRARPAPEQVSTLMARLGALMGGTRCGSPALVDSHRPGAFAMTPFQVTEVPVCRGLVSPKLAGRPLSEGGTRMALRRFRFPVPARVLIDRDRPIQVRTDRSGLMGGRVLACAGPWRTSGEWWKRPDSGGASGLEALRGLAGWDRDEWDVALGDGGLYRVFEDRANGRWFVDAIVD